MYGLLVLSAILQIVAIATPNWSKISNTNVPDLHVVANAGLWSICEEKTGCSTMDDPLTYVKTTQALSVTALVSWVLILIIMIFTGKRYIVTKLILMVFINLISIGALVAYSTKAFEDKHIFTNTEWGSTADKPVPDYSYYLYIVSLVLSMLATAYYTYLHSDKIATSLDYSEEEPMISSSYSSIKTGDSKILDDVSEYLKKGTKSRRKKGHY